MTSTSPTNHPPAGSVWRNHKGHLYMVICVADHTEHSETLVIYRPLHLLASEGDPATRWASARPLGMWYEHVLMGDVPRFVRVNAPAVPEK